MSCPQEQEEENRAISRLLNFVGPYFAPFQPCRIPHQTNRVLMEQLFDFSHFMHSLHCLLENMAQAQLLPHQQWDVTHSQPHNLTLQKGKGKDEKREKEVFRQVKSIESYKKAGCAFNHHLLPARAAFPFLLLGMTCFISLLFWPANTQLTGQHSLQGDTGTAQSSGSKPSALVQRHWDEKCRLSNSPWVFSYVQLTLLCLPLCPPCPAMKHQTPEAPHNAWH